MCTTHPCFAPKIRRWTFTASVCISLCAGLTYCFAIWSGELRSTFGLSQPQLELIASAANIGGYRWAAASACCAILSGTDQGATAVGTAAQDHCHFVGRANLCCCAFGARRIGVPKAVPAMRPHAWSSPRFAFMPAAASSAGWHTTRWSGTSALARASCSRWAAC